MFEDLIAIGVNHDSASVEVRERVAFAPEKIPSALENVIGQALVEEAVILSTCNRTEVYAVMSRE